MREMFSTGHNLGRPRVLSVNAACGSDENIKLLVVYIYHINLSCNTEGDGFLLMTTVDMITIIFLFGGGVVNNNNNSGFLYSAHICNSVRLKALKHTVFSCKV